MTDQDPTPPEGTEVAPPPANPPRKFTYNGMDLPDIDATMKPEQIRDVWAGTYPELANAKVKGPEKDAEGAQVYTFVRNVGHLGVRERTPAPGRIPAERPDGGLAMSEGNGGRPVLVTTAHRGVFFGYATDTKGETIELTRARNCVYWSADVKGFMGLASTGPSSSCKVGPPADIELRAVTSVVEVTPEAAEKWEAQPWSR